MADLDLKSPGEEFDVSALGDDLFDGWDDDSSAEPAENEEETNVENATDEEEDSEGSDQTEEETDEEEAESNNDQTQQKEETPKAEKKFTLKHLDEEKEYTAEEMIPLAQKGMDYDRIRGERDAMKANYAKYERCAKFLEDIKGDFDSVEALMDDTNAARLVKNEADNGRTITKEEALKRVKENRESETKKTETPKVQEQEDKSDADADRKAEIQRFSKALSEDGISVPNWSDLPKEVQEAFEKEGQLVAPYYRWLAKQKDNEAKTIKQNEKNRERSTGSRRTKGKGSVKNPLFDGFGDD